MSGDTCTCNCSTGLDSECDGAICKPHEAGRWVIVSPFMEHAMPTDFTTREGALGFIDAVGVDRLSTWQVEA